MNLHELLCVYWSQIIKNASYFLHIYTAVFNILELCFVWNYHPRHFILKSELDNIILDIFSSIRNFYELTYRYEIKNDKKQKWPV
jgi:hypothetical protein